MRKGQARREYEIRKEVCDEMQQQFVKIENMYRYDICVTSSKVQAWEMYADRRIYDGLIFKLRRSQFCTTKKKRDKMSRLIVIFTFTSIF